ncbi:MAG: cellulase [Kiritimatiellae bacterium]|jgi:hypothetical protein|nr:cellulase [Kiritimatiellia bacterium]
MNLHTLTQPLAITMWDFSWLERRWPGAGYENWDLALDELCERGYNAVRIDAYPHLLAEGGKKDYTLEPCWNQQDWGSPARNKVRPQPALNEFIRKCRDRDIHVGLSSWFQRDVDDAWKQIRSPDDHADIWKQTLDQLAEAELLDSILYVDFCNEWPLQCWAPFFSPDDAESRSFTDTSSVEWMASSIRRLRESYPDMALTYSYIGCLQDLKAVTPAVKEMDLLESHIWMAQANDGEFYKRVGYDYNRFDSKGYENVAVFARDLYYSDSGYWNRLLEQRIDAVCQEATTLGLPLITTECWGIVDYKDWPLLEWDWVKECTAHGLRYAAEKGQWLALSTSNFCGPQFVGMWRDVDWHRELTDLIKSSKLPCV